MDSAAAASAVFSTNSTAESVSAVQSFFTGSCGITGIVAVSIIAIGWKSLPFAWTVRVIGAMVNHLFVQPLHKLPPSALFHPVVTKSHVTLMEVDYNIHKSNSTYFSDMDVSRTHLAAHLLARGFKALQNNAQTKLVMDPAKPEKAAKGSFGIVLGGTSCSFKRELKPFQRYEMWSRVLAWDRKWIYVVTHFVEPGVKPGSWTEFNSGPVRKGDAAKPGEFDKKIFASGVTKYVFKLGRLTVHPSVVIAASGLLPDRPGGWTVTDEEGSPVPNGSSSEKAAGDLKESEWDWKKTEEMRLQGLQYASKFVALDGLLTEFDGGADGALGRFNLG